MEKLYCSQEVKVDRTLEHDHEYNEYNAIDVANVCRTQDMYESDTWNRYVCM